MRKILLFGTVVAVSLTASMTSAVTMAPMSQVRVMDSTGKEVGPVSSIDSSDDSAAVVFQIPDGRLIKLRVWRDRLGATDNVGFEAADCSGTPYFIVISDGYTILGPFPMAAVLPPGNSLYVEQPDGVREWRMIRSVYSIFTGCRNYEEGYLGDTVPAAQASGDLGFQQPYHVEPREGPPVTAGCCSDCNGDGKVKINELITGVTNSLGSCPAQ